MPSPLPPQTVGPATAPSALTPAVVVLILSALLGVQPLTTDLYLPALPALTEGFGAPMAQAQLTLSSLLLAFGLSQLVWGPLSDRFGRRPILMFGLAAYVVAGIGCALASSMEMLVVGRTLQGAAMGAGVMGARAIIRDLYTPTEAARVMSKALSGLAVVACLSAPLGGLLSGLFNWRIALLALPVFGAASLALVAWRFDETLTRKNPRALEPVTLFKTWTQIVRNPTFRAWSALSSTSYGGLFTFLATSSFVFIQVLHFSKIQYGLVMFSMSLSYMVGTFMCRRMLRNWGLRRAVAVAAAITLTSGTLLGIFGLTGLAGGPHGGWFILLPYYLFMLAHGVHQACSQSGAVAPFPQAAGAASALNGTAMMLVAFLMGSWLGTHMDGSVRPLTYGIWFWSVLIALSAWTLVQQHGEPGRAAGAGH
jgi:DHA1 family bicyclomycin/chloramphenicol resistance-like MFS transporter